MPNSVSGILSWILFSAPMMKLTAFTPTVATCFKNPMTPKITGSTTGRTLPTMSTATLMALTSVVPTRLTTVDSSGITAGIPSLMTNPNISVSTGLMWFTPRSTIWENTPAKDWTSGMTVWIAGVIAPNTSPRFSPPMLKPDSFSWMFCKPSGVESCPNTCFSRSPIPAILPVNLSNTARPPSPNTMPTMLRTSSKWSPSRETTATIVPRLVMAGPNIPSSDIKPPPSFAATGPTVEPNTFSPAPAN